MGLKCRLPSTLRREPRRDPSMGQGEGGSFSFLGTAASAASVRAGEELGANPAREARRGLGSTGSGSNSSASATQAPAQRTQSSFEPARLSQKRWECAQFRGARTLTGDRDTLATAPAQGQEERLGMGLSFPPILLRSRRRDPCLLRGISGPERCA